MNINEYQAILQNWIQENGETLIDIFLSHSGGGGTLYRLQLPDQVETAIKFAVSAAERYGDGQAVLTGFHSGYYPLRGNVDESFIEEIQLAWGGERWYSIASLEEIFPERLPIIGCGDTQQELENDLAYLMTNWKGRFVGFGENPSDYDDWAARNHVEVIEITVGNPRWKKINGT